LGRALAAKVRLIVWCKAWGHRAEPAVADQVASYGGDSHRLGAAAALHGLRQPQGRFRGQRRDALTAGRPRLKLDTNWTLL
jgi:hypothetical protein